MIFSLFPIVWIYPYLISSFKLSPYIYSNSYAPWGAQQYCIILFFVYFQSLHSVGYSKYVYFSYLPFFVINLQNFIYRPPMSNRIFVPVWHIHSPGVNSAPSQTHKCIFFQKTDKYYQAAHNKNYFCSVIHMIILPYYNAKHAK